MRIVFISFVFHTGKKKVKRITENYLKMPFYLLKLTLQHTQYNNEIHI